MILNNRLSKNTNGTSLAKEARLLLEEQKLNWPLLKENYQKLNSTRIKTFSFDNYEIKVQFNPERLISTGADVSHEAINNRPCFLCRENLPKEQKELVYDKNYVILCNPYPIFEEHFTIARTKHIPQTIINNFDHLLDLSEDLGEYYSLIYNGPKCGASAPDHLHFQAVPNNIIPIELNFEIFKQNKELSLISEQKINIYALENFLRFAIVFESNNKGELLYAFKILMKAMKNVFNDDEEPMINIITSNILKKWNVFIFPRQKHRPDQYFLNDGKKFTISPAAIDMGGLIISPDENDFNKIKKEDIIDIYRQVTITKEYMEYFKKKLIEAY